MIISILALEGKKNKDSPTNEYNEFFSIKILSAFGNARRDFFLYKNHF